MDISVGITIPPFLADDDTCMANHQSRYPYSGVRPCVACERNESVGPRVLNMSGHGCENLRVKTRGSRLDTLSGLPRSGYGLAVGGEWTIAATETLRDLATSCRSGRMPTLPPVAFGDSETKYHRLCRLGRQKRPARYAVGFDLPGSPGSHNVLIGPNFFSP